MTIPAFAPISCGEAKALGLSRYFTGIPCKRGHVALRNVKNCGCVECSNVLAVEWGAKNPERRRAACRAWYARNIKKEQKRGRDKRAARVEEYREYSIEYNALNLPRLAVIARNRRARQKTNGGKHTLQDIDELFVSQSGKCAYCKIDLIKYHVDHIQPLARGGSNGRENLQLLCVRCNKTKSARDPIEFMQERGMLL
jgi:5-methylcytosine-specific restriction endonuclease McrA